MTRLERQSGIASLFGHFAAVLVFATLAACSGGASTQENGVVTPPEVADYTGPAPGNADVQAFRINLWENIKPANRCGGCHNAGGQAPQFARNDDVNLAYQAAVSLVNLAQPSESRLVTKVGGGHNCWLAADSACADTMTVWIRNWAGATASGGRQIELQPPPIREVGASKSFPEDATRFAAVHSLLLAHCSRCHQPAAATPQSPFFAVTDIEEAYAAAQSKINLDDPAQSRLVVRLRDEAHYCWSSNCANDANEMLAAIQQLVPEETTPIDPTLVLSKALRLYDGTVAAGGNRYDNNVIALYEFKTGTGDIVYDTSGVEPALNLTRTQGTTEWVGGWGLNIKADGKVQGTTSASRKLIDLIKATGEFTIEVWAAPANVVQEDAFIVSYSAGGDARNFTLAQRAYQYEALVRTSETGSEGMPVLITNDEDEDAQAALQHIVLTYDPVNGRRLYVNGNFTEDVDNVPGGTLANWDDTFALVLGNDVSNNKQWQGVLRLVAIHNRALNLEQIQQNFAAGVGERYFLLFSVEHLIDVPKSYLMFEASQLDSYAYVFNKPTFISLDPDARPGSIPLRGIRIGLNGSELQVGQAYIPIDTTLTDSNYVPGSGQLLSNVGTAIPLQRGPMQDEFFLTFEQIGANSRNYPEPFVPVDSNLNPNPPTDVPMVGLRTFDEINQTLSNLTGVPTTTGPVRETYLQVKQSLPTVEQIDTFLAAHQSAVSQLAIKYCSALVDGDATRRNKFFGNLDPLEDGAYIYGQRNALVGKLRDNLIAAGLIAATDVSPINEVTTTETELLKLIDSLTSASDTRTARAGVVMKATCAAAIGGATMLTQ